MTVALNRDSDHPNAKHTAGTMIFLRILLHMLLQFEGLRLQIVAKHVISYVKSSLCLQCALHLGGQCHDLKALS